MLLALVGMSFAAAQLSVGSPGTSSTSTVGAAVVTVYEQAHARGLIVTTGGWAYCRQLRALAQRTNHTLLCGRYPKDGYLGPGLRPKRHLDWGERAYLRSLARAARGTHRRVGGPLVLMGVSYSGFGVATLATHHPELRPDRVIVIDSYLDLVARRGAARDGTIGREIDLETGGSLRALEARNVRVDRLARLVRTGTRVDVVWSISPEEAREFKGATCNRDANAAVLQRVADTLGTPVRAWVTTNRHGRDLWTHGREILRGRMPGRLVTFRPGQPVPPGTTCD
jgi:pimeloyl-ACP methyl ester carboxylesterase